jgi:hypothetical protein
VEGLTVNVSAGEAKEILDSESAGSLFPNGFLLLGNQSKWGGLILAAWA